MATDKCIKCGSYAFNLYKEDIDQGGLCDVHYWQYRAHRAEALAEQPAQDDPDLQDKDPELVEQPAQQELVAVELVGVEDAIKDGDGFWKPCTGCYETNEGYPPTGAFFSAVFKCHMGHGCSECGGIGAIWDDTDYEAMEDLMMRDDAAPQPAQQQEPWGACVSGRVFVGRLPEHARKLSEDEGVPIQWLYTSPPAQRTWVGLTDVEWMNIVNKDQAWFGQRPDEVAHEVAKLVEAKLKEKNT